MHLMKIIKQILGTLESKDLTIKYIFFSQILIIVVARDYKKPISRNLSNVKA